MLKDDNVQFIIAVISTLIMFFGSIVLLGNYFCIALFIIGSFLLVLFLLYNCLYD
jgi:hypothetical protein